jgi:pimeloyl-ACP methyl ester carboxylesterase
MTRERWKRNTEMPQIETPLVRWLLALTISVISSSLGASARTVDELSYRYPYRDPYLATTTIAIMKGRDEGRDNHMIRDLEIALLPGRNDVPLLEGKGKLRFRLYQNQGKVPLVIIVPGLGSSAYAGSASYIAELLFANGFHVMVLPDPLNWNFALAASTSGFPGDHFADAADMYRAMQFALRHVTDQQRVRIGKIGLMGFSEGALCAAFVDKLDSEQGSINFDTTLLVNPPVDPLAAIRKIDAMAQVGQSLSPDERARVQSYAFGTGVRALKKDYDDPDYFDDWDRRLRMTNKQIQYLIGAALFSDVGDTIYVIEQVKRPGVLKAPLSRDVRSARLDEARSMGLLGYLERFLLPRLRVDDPQLDIETLNASTSLRAIGPALAKSSRVFLMQNRDDILLSPGDIEYLEYTFGDRATIYPRGGHLGNLWYPPNKQDIVAHFRRLFGSHQWLEGLF